LKTKERWQYRFRRSHPVASAVVVMVLSTLLLPMFVVLWGIFETGSAYKSGVKEMWDIIRNKGQARDYWTQ